LRVDAPPSSGQITEFLKLPRPTAEDRLSRQIEARQQDQQWCDAAIHRLLMRFFAASYRLDEQL
jgi:hypothetical protein